MVESRITNRPGRVYDSRGSFEASNRLLWRLGCQDAHTYDIDTVPERYGGIMLCRKVILHLFLLLQGKHGGSKCCLRRPSIVVGLKSVSNWKLLGMALCGHTPRLAHQCKIFDAILKQYSHYEEPLMGDCWIKIRSVYQTVIDEMRAIFLTYISSNNLDNWNTVYQQASLSLSLFNTDWTKQWTDKKKKFTRLKASISAYLGIDRKRSHRILQKSLFFTA